ncbi:MAG: putative transport system permease protein [Actinomycetota bacterium]|nr:putative transport system permease protein [Actinomycetota bacterium]
MWRVLKGLLAHRSRLLRTASAVALAVSLVSGTFVLTDTIDAAFQRASTSSAQIDVVVRASAQFAAQATTLPERATLPESLLDVIAAIPGVDKVWGQVMGFAELVDKDGKPISPSGLPPVGTAFSSSDTLVTGRPPVGPGEVVIDDVTAAKDGFRPGDQIKVLFQGLVREFVITGVRKVNDLLSSTTASFDLTTAQQLMGEAGTLDAIPVKAAAGVSPEVMRARIGAVLPESYEVVTYDQAAREAQESWTKALGFLTTALLLFAAVALLVGAFIIFNTFSILVAQRTRELGLLRAVGASRWQLIGSVLAEALLVGVVASAAGIVLGLGAAHGLLAIMRMIGFELPSAPIVFRGRTAAMGLVAGVVVTVAAAIVPARRATKVSPMAAIVGRSADDAVPTGRRLGAGATVAGLGLGSLFLGLFGRMQTPLLAIGLGSAGILVGIAMLTPLVATPAARLLGLPLVHLLGQPGLLGRENAMRNPRRTSATAAALMIGITLVGVVAIVAASIKSSASHTIQDTLRADLVVTPRTVAGAQGSVPTAVGDKLRKAKAVALVSEIRSGQWGLQGRTKTLVAVDPRTVTEMYELDPAAAQAVRRLDESRFDDKGVLVRASVAERHGWVVGDEVPMTFARTGVKPMVVADTFTSTAVRSDYVISLDTYKANFKQQASLEVDVRLKPGITAAAGRQAVEAALVDFPNVEARDRSQVLAAQEKQVDKLLVPVTALLALSVVIALLGIVNTLALSIHERTRELGLLRAVGMGRGQMRSMVRAEAVIIAGLGALLGVVVAVFFGWALVGAMSDLGVSRLVVPVRQLLALVAAATVAGLLAGVLPARRAARLPVLDAISAG